MKEDQRTSDVGAKVSKFKNLFIKRVKIIFVGVGMPKPKKERPASKVIISKQQRKGNKYVTIISGLAANGINIDSAKKFLAQKFACSCSKGDADELIIQGDVLDNLFDVIPEQYSEVRVGRIFDTFS